MLIGLQERGPAAILSLPDPSLRPARPRRDVEGPRGEILLFTGVRYERAPDPTPSGPSMPDGRPARRRRRS